SNEGNGIGFQINCSYNSISRNVISNNEGHGIQISDECNYNSISENIATGNHETGIYLVYSENNKILGNTANDNYRNIYEYWVHGIHLFQSDNNTLLENTVNNNTNGIFLEYSKHNDIAGNTARYNKLNHFEFGNGIFFLSSGNNNISGNILNNNVGGINIERCSNNSFINNTANYNSYFGIGGSNSNFNIISDNNIKYNALVGIGFIDCYYNNISRNFVDNHSLVGIGFIESHFNSIFDNIITNNLWGIYLNQSCRNDVYGNIFMNNTNGDFFEEPGDNCPPKGLIPVAFFTATPTIISLSNSIVQFQFRGYEGDGPTTFQWNFGDDTANSTEKNPTHRYTSPGIYTVILTVIDSDGDSDVLKRLNYIIVREETIIPGFDVFFLLSILSLITVTIGKNFKKIKPQFKISQKINTDFLRSKLNWKIYGVQQFVRRVQNIVL
ncbi:MAG: NosD domain-containing protein, partial [Candidatus Hermodarchaeota archaeon]